MATPPTKILTTTPTVGWSSPARPKTSPAFDVQAGDLLTLIAFAENESHPLQPPTWTGTGTWTLQRSSVASGYSPAYVYTCPVTATETARTVSVTKAATSNASFSFIVSVWRGHGGVGASNVGASSGAPSLGLTVADNSAIMVGNSDWNAINGASRVWRTVNGSPIAETSYGGTVGVDYVNYTGWVSDAGTAGSKTLGLSAPGGQK